MIVVNIVISSLLPYKIMILRNTEYGAKGSGVWSQILVESFPSQCLALAVH